ncbi:apolipoprotein A1/A4/E family protein [Microbacterium sp. PAMC 28756]|uniref:apolipoprotein A1/A4/E family protein n=1 Tax=Microbacterium sp. PAMC 28756 TaxID=1795053 RepID=UPI001E28D032|nr:apolipoprotein A1/A4/E family protein [Microbacterium sp. PAMC 28756]
MTDSSSPIEPARDLFTDAGIPTGARTATTYRQSHTRTEEGSTVSADTLTIIVSAIGVVLTLGASLFAAGAWMIRRIDERLGAVDHRLSTGIGSVEEKLGARIGSVEEKLGARIDSVEEKLGARIDSVEEKLGARIDTVEEKLGARIDAVAADVTDLKIAVARLEGPPRHLLVSGS